VLRFDANLGMLFCELTFRERFGAAARAGFRAVEYPFPYSYPLAELQERLEQNGLVQVLHNLPPGDLAKGERGIACLPDRKGEFQDSVGLALEYARGLRCPQVRRATLRGASRSACPASVTSRWRTIPAGTNRAPAASTTGTPT